MAVVSVRMNEEESRLFMSYAKLHGLSISEAYKRALLEKIEDEFDAADLIEAAARFEKEPKTHSLDELRKTYGL
ncbi:MAG: DUF6290 family protein [Bacilli bacterium]|nr:DUF6290 family protein [Bacilli bacterium]MDD7181502.1 DUF6290 family protein [Bacilli bacterium]